MEDFRAVQYVLDNFQTDFYMYLPITFQYKQQGRRDSYIILKHIQLWSTDDLFKMTAKFHSLSIHT